MINKTEFFGESVYSNDQSIHLVCWKNSAIPNTWSLVEMGGNIGLVTHISTINLDKDRLPTPLEMTPEEISYNFPHLSELTQTQASMMILVHNKPILLHQWARALDQAQIKQLFSWKDLIQLIAKLGLPKNKTEEAFQAMVKIWRPSPSELEDMFDLYTIFVEDDLCKVELFFNTIEKAAQTWQSNQNKL